MRLPTRERASLTESTSPAQRDLFDAVPTRGRSPTANRPRGWVWLAARSLVAVAPPEVPPPEVPPPEVPDPLPGADGPVTPDPCPAGRELNAPARDSTPPRA